MASQTQLVNEAIQQELNHIADLHTATTLHLEMGLLTEIEEFEADIVVLLNRDDKVSGVVDRVFDNFPGILIVVFNPENERAIVCERMISREQASETNLAKLIQRISQRDRFNYWDVQHEQTS